MAYRFTDFMKQLKETHFSLKDYVDFPKVAANVEAVSIKLNQLNYLIGQEDMAAAVKRLWDENPKVFSVLDVLIAVRPKDRKKAIDVHGNIHLLSDYFDSPEHVTEFIEETGLGNVFRNKQIKNLVDYVFGVEVGLDSNARKNRGGHIMEDLVAKIFTFNGIPFRREVYYTEFPEIVKALGADNKRFDFVIRTKETIYLIEANFYSSGGSKLNEVARSYSELAPKINAVPGFEFVWITDGIGWESARNKLEEAFVHIPKVYNLTNITEFIDLVKHLSVQ
ncbi:MAG: type II restriction endonuclease [Muribaculaceae bacterium]|nr:type II restriction endonuclease [Muribaculaceae bacterium]